MRLVVLTIANEWRRLSHLIYLVGRERSLIRGVGPKSVYISGRNNFVETRHIRGLSRLKQGYQGYWQRASHYPEQVHPLAQHFTGNAWLGLKKQLQETCRANNPFRALSALID